jgi:glucose/arabinose dehydrogenase
MQLSFGGTWSILAPEVLISMTQRLLTSRVLASTAMLLAASGLIGLACGSDSHSPGVTEGESPLNPDPSMSDGTGGSSATTSPSETPGGGSGPLNTAGTEGQSPDVPLNPGDDMNAGGSGTTNTPPTTPTQTGLTPNCNPPEGTPPALALELVAGGLNQPLFVTGAPGDDTRLFVVEQGGTVRVIVNGQLQEQPFLDISGNVVTGSERGLLGLAFHPNYAENGLFYVHFSSAQNNGDGVIAEFAVDANNRSVANVDSRRDVLVFANDPQPNHNGGNLVFGADKFLYVGMGDGGGGNDQHGQTGNGQNLQSLLGKMLRIDVNGRDVNNAYSIPPNNLAVQISQNALPEIWAYGLRNPWRFSFDACTQDLYIGDVGQDTIEEVDFLPSTVPAGTNFGWRIMEGPDCRPTDAICPMTDISTLKLPVDSYPRNVGTSITGGYVYRGSAVPGLRGRYIYADYNSARFFTFRMEGDQMLDRQEVTDQINPGGDTVDGIASFGTDNAGEVYVAAFEPQGAVYRIVAAQ